MMKKYYQFLVLCASTGIFAQQQYCQPTFQYGADGNMITRVVFGDIDKTSPAQSGTTPIVEDFTSLSTNLQIGSTNLILIKGPSSTFPSDVVVFIDFNNNGNFDDSGESFYIGRLASANPANANTITSNIEIPQNANLGVTRMRVLKDTNVNAYSDPNVPNKITNACQSLRSGQAEDYSVNIVPSSLSTNDIKKLDFKIHPNPTQDFVEIESKEELKEFELYNQTGQIILKGNTRRIDLRSISSGNYFLKITLKNNQQTIQKIIKK